MNLVGAVDAAAFDASQSCGRRAVERMPGCDTILLLGSGGRSAWQAAVGDGKPPRPGRHPIDRWSAAVARDVEKLLVGAGCRVRVVRPDDRPPMNFRQLGEAAGFGTVSPVIGHLLHPEFGPWVSLRVALLIEGRPFRVRALDDDHDFAPCCDCSQPCVRACPADVHARPGVPDVVRCAGNRVAGGCRTGCEVLRACPIGAAHRYGAEEEAHRHAHSLRTIRRWVGAGAWRLVPSFVRRRW